MLDKRNASDVQAYKSVAEISVASAFQRKQNVPSRLFQPVETCWGSLLGCVRVCMSCG